MTEQFGKRTIRSVIEREKETLRPMSRRERLRYIFAYYKWSIAVVAAVLAVIVLIVCLRLRGSRVAMYAVFVNADESSDTLILDRLLEEDGLLPGGKHVELQANYSLYRDELSGSDGDVIQILSAEFGVGDLDLFVADKKVFDMFAEKGGFENAGLMISAELKQKYPDDIYTYEDEDGNTVAGGVRLRDGSLLHRAGYYSGDVLAGIVSNAEHLDEALALMEKLLASNPAP